MQRHFFGCCRNAFCLSCPRNEAIVLFSSWIESLVDRKRCLLQKILTVTKIFPLGGFHSKWTKKNRKMKRGYLQILMVSFFLVKLHLHWRFIVLKTHEFAKTIYLFIKQRIFHDNNATGLDCNHDANTYLPNGSGSLFGVLAPVLAIGSSSGLVSLVKYLLPVLVHLQLDDADHGCLEADRSCFIY